MKCPTCKNKNLCEAIYHNEDGSVKIVFYCGTCSFEKEELLRTHEEFVKKYCRK